MYYGIGEDTPTQTPVQARRARRTAALWAGFAALVCAVAAVLALFFSGGSAPAEKVFSVTVGSAVFEVGENDWFTPPEPFPRRLRFCRLYRLRRGNRRFSL